MCYKIVASMGCLAHFGHRAKHVVYKILYYRFARDAGVGSFLMAQGRITCEDTCGADIVKGN